MFASISWKKSKKPFHGIIKVRCGEKEVTKEKLYAAKKPLKFWNFNVDNIVASKLVETKANYKYLIRLKFDKAIRPLVLIMPKMIGYVRTFKVNITATDLRYLARRKAYKSLAYKKSFSLIRQLVFKLGNLFCQEWKDIFFEFKWTQRKVASDNDSL